MGDFNVGNMGTGFGYGASLGAFGGPVAAGVGGVLGGVAGGMGLFGDPDEQRVSNAPWGVQAPYLEAGYGYAKDAYNQTKDMSDWEKAAYQQSRGFLGQAGQMGQNWMGQGQQQMDQGLGLWNQYAQKGPEQIQYNYGNVQDQIDNDILQGQIDASTRDMYRDFRENQIPQSALSAAGGGIAGGSRQHQMEAILGRSAVEQASDVAANMRYGAYNQGMQNEMQRAHSQAGMNQGYNQNMMNQGMGMAGFGQGLAGSGYQMANQANQMNLGLANQMRMDPWAAVNQYQSAIGSPFNQGFSYGPSSQMQGMGLGLQGMTGAMRGMEGRAQEYNRQNNPNNPYQDYSKWQQWNQQQPQYRGYF